MRLCRTTAPNGKQRWWEEIRAASFYTQRLRYGLQVILMLKLYVGVRWLQMTPFIFCDCGSLNVKEKAARAVLIRYGCLLPRHVWWVWWCPVSRPYGTKSQWPDKKNTPLQIHCVVKAELSFYIWMNKETLTRFVMYIVSSPLLAGGRGEEMRYSFLSKRRKQVHAVVQCCTQFKTLKYF